MLHAIASLLRPKSRPKAFDDLPDKVELQIMTHLPSMRDKLRMGAVSRRLHERADEHLRTCTWPLELVFRKNQFKSENTESQFAVDVRPFILYARRMFINRKVLCSLARKTCFSDIIFHLRTSEEMASIEQACLALSQHPDCLSKTKAFKIDYEDWQKIRSLSSLNSQSAFTWSRTGQLSQPNHPLPDITYQVLGHCTSIQGLQFHHVSPKFPALQESLNGKSLTEIVLEYVHVSYNALRDLFVSLKPNTLKSVRLYVIMQTKEEDDWSIAQFFQQMSQGPWSAVESLHYNFCPLDLWPHDINVLGNLLNLFPKLINGSCRWLVSFDQTLEHQIECIARFLKSAENRGSVGQSVSFGNSQLVFRPACEIAELMERIIVGHYSRTCQLTVKPIHDNGGVIGSKRYVLSISQAMANGNAMATFNITNLEIMSCAEDQQIEQNDDNQGPCEICRRFYGNMSEMIMHVMHNQGGHIDDYFMNPCQSEQLQQELRVLYPNRQVHVNRDEGTGSYVVDVDQVHITIDSQRCIVPGCTMCLEEFGEV